MSAAYDAKQPAKDRFEQCLYVAHTALKNVPEEERQDFLFMILVSQLNGLSDRELSAKFEQALKTEGNVQKQIPALLEEIESMLSLNHAKAA